MKSEPFCVKELTITEQSEIFGGNPIIVFIAGAIVGGIIYDAYKAVSLAIINAQIEHPEYYDGAVHSQR